MPMRFCMGYPEHAMLDWDDLRFFLAVARAGSMTAAASELGVAQPTVGRRLSGLEEQLGAKLFQHLPSGQALSTTGQRLLGHAERMELSALAVARVASGRDAGLRGRVVITASEWLVASVLGPALAPFSADHPELELELLADPRHLSLARREAELALRPSRFTEAAVVSKRVASLSFGLYASAAYLAEHGAPDFSAGAAGHRLVAMSETLTAIPDPQWLAKVAGKARIVARANGRLAMVTLAESGVGLACLPRFLGDLATGLHALPTPEPGPERALWLGAHRDARSVPRVAATIEFLSRTLARLSPALCPAS